MSDQNAIPTPEEVVKLFREVQSGIAYAGTSEEHENLSGFVDNVLHNDIINGDNFMAMVMLLAKHLNSCGLGLEHLLREARELLRNYETSIVKNSGYKEKDQLEEDCCLLRTPSASCLS